jgi:N utilization substance protein B
MTSRHEARRQALVLLYQWDVTGQPLGSLADAGPRDPFAEALALDVIANADELDRRITAASHEWTAERLGAVERTVLRMAVQELDRGQVPREVVIDQAVELAKRYASPEAASLVNGILARIAREAA